MFDELPLTAIILGILMVEGTFTETAQRTKAGEERGAETVVLPAPTRVGHMSLEEALARRRSVREFSAKPLAKEQLGQLLWAAQGTSHGDGLRTAPSAGALYPLEIYLATSAGFFHYDPVRHELQRRSDCDLRPELHRAALAQEPVLKAPAVFIVTAVYERTIRKYGADRSPRYVHLEAGHAAQNLLLEAVALGLGSVPIGAFDDPLVQKVLSLPPEQQPIYLIPVGTRGRRTVRPTVFRHWQPRLPQRQVLRPQTALTPDSAARCASPLSESQVVDKQRFPKRNT